MENKQCNECNTSMLEDYPCGICHRFEMLTLLMDRLDAMADPEDRGALCRKVSPMLDEPTRQQIWHHYLGESPSSDQEPSRKKPRLGESPPGILDLDDHTLKAILAYLQWDATPSGFWMLGIVDNLHFSLVCKRFFALSDDAERRCHVRWLTGVISRNYALGERCTICAQGWKYTDHKFLWRIRGWICKSCVKRRRRVQRSRTCHAMGYHHHHDGIDVECICSPKGCDICLDIMYQ